MIDYNRNNTRKTNTQIDINPSVKNSNYQARRDRALLIPVPSVNNRFGMSPEYYVPLITMHYV